MRTKPAAVASLAIVSAMCASHVVAFAAVATPKPTSRSIAIPLEERHGSGVHGTVRLTPAGPKTIIDIKVNNPARLRSALTLDTGQDCQDSPGGAMHDIALNALSSAQASHTIVSIPIGSFKSKGFVVSIRDATTRQQLLDA